MAISTESEARRQEGRSAGELEAVGNQFAAFIDVNRLELAEYASLSRQYRLIRRAWEAGLVPHIQNNLDKVKKFVTNSKMLARVEGHFRHDALGPRLSLSNPDVEENGSAGVNQDELPFIERMQQTMGVSSHGVIDGYRAAIDRHSPLAPIMEEADVILRRFNSEYHEAIDEAAEGYNDVWQDLGRKTGRFFMSDYQALVDTLNFLSVPNNVRGNSEIVAFFRDLAISDNMLRKNGKEGITAYIRSQWQARLMHEFNPVVFERFWEDISNSGKSQDLVELVSFGVTLDRYNSGRGDREKPTVQEVRVAISMVPFEMWPKKLKDAYFLFAKNDSAILAEALHTKMLEVFPNKQRKTVIHADTNGNGSSKRKANRDEQSSESEDASSDTSDVEMEGTSQLKLGILKKDPASRNGTHFMIPIVDEEVDAQIAKLASVGTSPEMVADFVAILGKMRDPLVLFGPAVHRILGNKDHVTIDYKDFPVSRIKPEKIPGISLQDPQTIQARIMFTVIDSRLLISGVFAKHDDYERTLGRRTS